MAYITVGSKFTPFTYEEKIKPYQDYITSFREVENTYSDLETKANTIATSINESTDPESYRKYVNLYNQLKNEADKLSTEGLTSERRKNLRNLYRNYSETMLPIAQAIDKRDKELAKRDPNKFYEKDIISLDDLVNNQNYDFGSSFSLDDLTTNMAKLASPYSKTNRGSSQWYTTAGGQLLERKNITGYTEEEINRIVSGEDTTSPLAVLMRNYIDDIGVLTWDSFTDSEGNLTEAGQRKFDKVWKAVSKGLSSAIGTSSYEHIVNKDYVAPNKKTKPTLDDIRANTRTEAVFGDNQKEVTKLYEQSVLNKNEYGSTEFAQSYIPQPYRKSPIEMYNESVNNVTYKPEKGYASNYLEATPIDIYKVWDEETKTIRKELNRLLTLPTYGNPLQGNPTVIRLSNELDSKTQEIKNRYNVQEILTPEQYQTITSLDSNYDGVSFNYATTSLSSIAKSYSDSANFNKSVKDKIAIGAAAEGNKGVFKKDTVYELKDGQKKEVKSTEDILSSNSRIIDTSYNKAYPDYIEVKIELTGKSKKGESTPIYKRYLIKPDVFSTTLSSLLRDYVNADKIFSSNKTFENEQILTDAYYEISKHIAELLNPKKD